MGKIAGMLPPPAKQEQAAAFSHPDAKGHEHAPAGSPEGGQFTGKESGAAGSGPPSVDSLHAHVAKLKASGNVSIADLSSTVRQVMHLRVGEIHDLAKKLGVAASGAKGALAAKIVRRALAASPDEPETYRLKPERAAASRAGAASREKLPPLADRLERITRREQQGGAPFADMLVAALKQQKSVPRDLPASAVIGDLRREALGKPPLNSSVSREQLAAALSLIALDFGRLTAAEMTRVLPHLDYPEQTAPGAADKESIIRQRRIPADVLDRIKTRRA